MEELGEEPGELEPLGADGPAPPLNLSFPARPCELLLQRPRGPGREELTPLPVPFSLAPFAGLKQNANSNRNAAVAQGMSSPLV